METDPERWRIIVGLGNPGKQYAWNRHNIGFQVLDMLAARNNVKFTRMVHRGLVAVGDGALRRVVLLKPQTFMNESGASVGAIAQFYKCRHEDVLVVHDELDLPFGQLRMRQAGGAAGHNGVRSIIARLGSQHFPRLRFGIGRPPGRMQGADFVLQDFLRDEQASIDADLCGKAADGAMRWVADGIERAMNIVNAAGPATPG